MRRSSLNILRRADVLEGWRGRFSRRREAAEGIFSFLRPDVGMVGEGDLAARPFEQPGFDIAGRRRVVPVIARQAVALGLRGGLADNAGNPC